MMDPFVETEAVIIELLLVVSLVAIAIRSLRIPYTVALVIVGLIITSQQSLGVDLTSNLILALFVPPLIFDASFHLQFRQLREYLVPILILAIPGVLLTTIIIGVVVASGVMIPLPIALVFGAMMAATDPVAVIALFKTLGVPKPLEVLVKGESILNNGTAIVVFNLMMAIAAATIPGLSGQAEGESLGIVRGLLDFARVGLGGAGIGLALGWLVARFISGVDDHLIVTTLTTVLAFGSFLIAEHMEVSGILAVFGAGLMCGNIGPKAMSPTTRIVLSNFWDYLTFLANSLVFLLIGLDIDIPDLIEHTDAIGIAIGAALISRVITVYGLVWGMNQFRSKIPLSYQHVMAWGGLRGAVGLALALSLDSSFPHAELLREMAFGIVLFTLLVQATTMNPLLRWLGLARRADEVKLEHQRRQGRLMAARAARDHLYHLHDEGLISGATWEYLSPRLDSQIQHSIAAQQALLYKQPALLLEEREDAWREGLRAQRAMLSKMLTEGLLTEEVYAELVTEVDAVLDQHNKDGQGQGKFPQNAQTLTGYPENGQTLAGYPKNRQTQNIPIPDVQNPTRNKPPKQ
ncbi:MAG: Na+/H+ antiporter [Chloroflexales bacterium]|nr:Na+/H+ antiporter [Chloroflexales bacterium]